MEQALSVKGSAAMPTSARAKACTSRVRWQTTKVTTVGGTAAGGERRLVQGTGEGEELRTR